MSLIGLFMYKKWGFYLFTLYLAYILIDNVIHLNYTALIIFAIIYGYLIWYKGFYKNFFPANKIKSEKIIETSPAKKRSYWVFFYILAIIELLFGVFFFFMLLYAIFGYERDFLIISIFVVLSFVFLFGGWSTLNLGKKRRFKK